MIDNKGTTDAPHRGTQFPVRGMKKFSILITDTICFIYDFLFLKNFFFVLKFFFLFFFYFEIFFIYFKNHHNIKYITIIYNLARKQEALILVKVK